MVTQFGKVLRKLRLDRDELLRDMAVRLGFSSSYLSSIEVGTRTIPDDLIERLRGAYCLTPDDVFDLERAKAQVAGKVTVGLGDASMRKMEAAIVFARRFGDLDEKTAMDIKNIIDRIPEAE